jgi:uncharacterized PurR-regulated membrane protein YhhQ (DUF165 family)
MAAAGILIVMIGGFVAHFILSAIFGDKSKTGSSTNYWLSVIVLVFFALYQFLRGFAHPLLKTTMGRLTTSNNLREPTTTLSLALAAGRFFHSISALLFLGCLICVHWAGLPEQGSSTQALVALVVLITLAVVVLNVVLGLFLGERKNVESDLGPFFSWQEMRSMVGKRSFRSTVVKGAFFVCLVLSNILAPKFSHIGWLEFNAGALAYALSFMLVDTIAETEGKGPSRQLWLAGIATYLVVFLLVLFAVLLPGGHNKELQDVFNQLFENFVQKDQNISFVVAFDAIYAKGILSFVIASLCSFSVAQYMDIWLFLFLKKIGGKQGRWIRNNLSTFMGQTVDTIIFILVVSFLLQAAVTSRVIWRRAAITTLTWKRP